jgi:4-diphosphocytidyl-2-C-methyl-D-erythritol kinase
MKNKISKTFPGKLNLYLNIFSKQSATDEKHQLETIFYPLPIYETISVEKSDQLSIIPSGKYAEQFPALKNSLLYKTVTVFSSVTGTETCYKIEVDCNLKNSSGLGASSVEAANLLLCLNGLNNDCLTNEELQWLGSELGSDVNFGFYDKPCLGTNYGDKLKPIELPKYHIVLALFNKEFSTAKMYSELDKEMPSLDKNDGYFNSFLTLAAKYEPRIKQVIDLAYNNGAIGSNITGKGPTVFALFNTPDSANSFATILEQVNLEQASICDEVLVC